MSSTGSGTGNGTVNGGISFWYADRGTPWPASPCRATRAPTW